ncbi:MAG: hypothetical protein OXC15_08615 [Rhodospirillaceae bacterium]|nr:hypothetical protein [Rhodospirillaceae bacterium]
MKFIALAIVALALAACSSTSVDVTHSNGEKHITAATSGVALFNLNSHKAVCKDTLEAVNLQCPDKHAAVDVGDVISAAKTIYGLLPVNEYTWEGTCQDYSQESARCE